MKNENVDMRLVYAAGYLSSRKARIEKVAGILSVSAWNHDPVLAQSLNKDFGGGVTQRARYTVWTLSGPAAVEFLTKLLPVASQFPSELPEAIRAALEAEQ